MPVLTDRERRAQRRRARAEAANPPPPPPTRQEQLDDTVATVRREMWGAHSKALRHERFVVENVARNGAIRAASDMEEALKARADADTWDAIRVYEAKIAGNVRAWIEYTLYNETKADPLAAYSDEWRAQVIQCVSVVPSEREARILYFALTVWSKDAYARLLRDVANNYQIRPGSVRDAAELFGRTAVAECLQNELSWPLSKLGHLFP